MSDSCASPVTPAPTATAEIQSPRKPFARVFPMPGEDHPLVTLKPCWVADNYLETACFPTKDEAIAFAERRWGAEAVVLDVAP